MPYSKTVTIGEVCKIIGGGTPSRTRSEFFGGNIPWATVKDFKFSVISKTKESITDAAVAASATNIVPPRTVLLVSRIGLGKVAIAGVALAINQDVKALTPREDVLPEYLYWFLLSKTDHFVRIGVGATVKGITLDDIKAVKMPLPSIHEQQRIVDLLSRAEGIVHLRLEAQQKAAELIPTVFLEMFGDPRTNPKRLPIYALEDLMLSPPTLGTMAKPSVNQAKWLDLRVANIQGGSLTLDDRKWLDLSEREIERFQLVAGDVILARAIGSLDHLGKAVVVYPDSQWTFDSHLMRLRFDSLRLLSEWFVPYLSSVGGRAEFLKHTRQSAVQFNINGKEIRKLQIPLPPLEAQKSFCARTEEIRSISTQQAAATEKAEEVFQSLLSAAFKS